MRRVAAGDEGAFRALVERYQRPLIAVGVKMLGGDQAAAEDVAQQTFVKLWKSAPKYVQEEKQVSRAKFSTYLFTIHKRAVIDLLRKWNRRQEKDLGAVEQVEHEEIGNSVSPSEGTAFAELEKAVEEAIAQLPETQRAALILRRYEGMGYDAIAQVLEMSVSAVKSQLFRARQSLRAALKMYLE